VFGAVLHLAGREGELVLQANANEEEKQPEESSEKVEIQKILSAVRSKGGHAAMVCKSVLIVPLLPSLDGLSKRDLERMGITRYNLDQANRVKGQLYEGDLTWMQPSVEERTSCQQKLRGLAEAYFDEMSDEQKFSKRNPPHRILKFPVHKLYGMFLEKHANTVNTAGSFSYNTFADCRKKYHLKPEAEDFYK